MTKSKVHIYLPVDVQPEWETLLAKVVELRKSEGKGYTPYHGLKYTVSEVVIDAIQELAKEWDARQEAEEKAKSVKKS